MKFLHVLTHSARTAASMSLNLRRKQFQSCLFCVASSDPLSENISANNLKYRLCNIVTTNHSSVLDIINSKCCKFMGFIYCVNDVDNN